MKICMIGAGYVGLVSAACFSEFGWTVTCVDKDEARLAELSTLLADATVYADPDRARSLMSEYEALNPKLEQLLAEWEALAEAG